MVCIVEIGERPKLHDPVLIEGLPGIGFVANITALHLIHELGARRFGEIHSSSFQDLAVTTANGATLSTLNELY
jgi:proteasome assembly chaperone (PAC2) family protein